MMKHFVKIMIDKTLHQYHLAENAPAKTMRGKVFRMADKLIFQRLPSTESFLKETSIALYPIFSFNHEPHTSIIAEASGRTNRPRKLNIPSLVDLSQITLETSDPKEKETESHDQIVVSRIDPPSTTATTTTTERVDQSGDNQIITSEIKADEPPSSKMLDAWNYPVHV